VLAKFIFNRVDTDMNIFLVFYFFHYVIIIIFSTIDSKIFISQRKAVKQHDIYFKKRKITIQK